MPKGSRETWGVGWFWSGMVRAARWGLEVSLLAVMNVKESGAYLCAQQSPVPSSRAGRHASRPRVFVESV